ncbi:MAG: endonuclease III [Candidatus Marinimicrobia bacterium]|nr:endonuclease III [Candidatus Neomarinimicrobiota bacterium]|tara:strand:+ start:1345 stop:2004 length:660 start_codon:yes stop_codon:yes gene_type:complete
MPKESLKNKKNRMEKILKALKTKYPDSKCSLNYESPFQLLVATILSAQCTDERVNKVTKKLFNDFPDVFKMNRLTKEEIGEKIYSTGFYNNKAKSLKNLCKTLIKNYNGKVPTTMEELYKLPGTGRKTANVVLGNAFKIPGMVVDTHVTRIANLLKFVNTKNAVKIEIELEKVVPKQDWTLFSHLLIDHGRAVCIANRPQCLKCMLSENCPSSRRILND